MSTETTLVTGANRGLGLGIARQYLSKANQTVIAAVRDPSKATDLKSSEKGANSRLILVQIDSADNTQPAKAIAQLQSEYGIKAIDAVIANAGVALFDALGEQKLKDLTYTLQVNVVAPLSLYQATLPLLQNSSNPRFVTIGSLGGSSAYVDKMPFFPNGAYGVSKAAVHFLMRKLAFEAPAIAAQGGKAATHKKVTIFSVHPGIVGTDMGVGAVEALHKIGVDPNELGFIPISIDESGKGIKDVIDAATFESANGKLLNYGDGAELPF